jgi:hypothetical protein
MLNKQQGIIKLEEKRQGFLQAKTQEFYNLL